MMPHHRYELKNRLERVQNIGCAEITRDELLRWFDQQRMTKGVWRGIRDEWAELEDSPENTLLIGDSDPTFVFVWGGEGLDVGEKAWLKDVRHLAD